MSSNVGFPQGTLSKGNPIDFNAAGEELRGLSQYLATLTGATRFCEVLKIRGINHLFNSAIAVK